MGLLELAKKRFKLCQESESAQRQDEHDDLKFQVPELQWDEAAKRQRMGETINGVPIPARPMLSIDKLAQPIQLIMNQARTARLGVNIHPVSEDSDTEGAEVRQGLYRRIERDSNADHARLWALQRAVICGRGAYRINTKWDEDAPEDSFDQEIVIERILDQGSVYFDPSATLPDFSDGEFAFVTQWMTEDEFKRQYPEASVSKAENEELEWEQAYKSAPNWVRTDDNGVKSVLVAEYWYKEHEITKIEGPGGKSREKDIVSVFKVMLSGSEELTDPEPWNGHYIPLVPVVGRELIPFDDRRRWMGMVRSSKDGQKAYNFGASTLVERMALEPKMPFLIAEGQQEGYEAMWQQANLRNFPYLLYKPTSIGDKPVGPPQRMQLDQTGMSLAMMLMQESDRFIQTTTSVYDPSLGRESARDKSGKAILALQQQSDAGTSHFLASLADVSMRLEARIVLDLMPSIYDRPGRVTTILKGDDSSSEPIMLNQAFVMGQDGRPMPAQQGAKGAQEYDLSRGKYAVSVDIGKSFQTRLQQGQDEIGQILSSDPSLMPLIGDIYFRFRDFPGSKEIADRLKMLAQKTYPGLTEEGENQDASVLAAQVQTLQQQLGEAQGQLQEAAKVIETKQAEQMAKLETAKLDSETRLAIAKMDNEVKIQIETMKVQAQGTEKAATIQADKEADEFEAAHETGLALIDQVGKLDSRKPEPPDAPIDNPKELDE